MLCTYIYTTYSVLIFGYAFPTSLNHCKKVCYFPSTKRTATRPKTLITTCHRVTSAEITVAKVMTLGEMAFLKGPKQHISFEWIDLKCESCKWDLCIGNSYDCFFQLWNYFSQAKPDIIEDNIKCHQKHILSHWKAAKKPSF